MCRFSLWRRLHRCPLTLTKPWKAQYSCWTKCLWYQLGRCFSVRRTLTCVKSNCSSGTHSASSSFHLKPICIICFCCTAVCRKPPSWLVTCYKTCSLACVYIYCALYVRNDGSRDCKPIENMAKSNFFYASRDRKYICMEISTVLCVRVCDGCTSSGQDTHADCAGPSRICKKNNKGRTIITSENPSVQQYWLK